MKRRIIRIEEALCNGCGQCARACHEGAIGMVVGKARLLHEHYCDGLGDCLPACPTGAISFEEREAPAYNEVAVQRAKAAAGGCPGVQMRLPDTDTQPLSNWPVQIKLAPVQAPYFAGADLLIAADCTAYAYAHFHAEFLRGRTVLVGCPKLDAVDYTEKLTEIFAKNDIRSIMLTRMEVPCCGGLEYAVKRALQERDIPLRVVTIGIDGTLK